MLAAEGSPSLDGAPEVPASWTWKLLSKVAQLKGGVTKGRKLAGRRWVTLWASGSWRAVVLGPFGGDSVHLNTSRGDSVLRVLFQTLMWPRPSFVCTLYSPTTQNEIPPALAWDRWPPQERFLYLQNG